MTDNLDPNPAEAKDHTVFDPDKDYLEEYTKEGGKFYDPDKQVAYKKLARGKAESDAFITSITHENKEIRAEYQKTKEELNARARLEDLVTQLSSLRAATTSKGDEGSPPNETKNEPVIKPDDIEKLVSSKLNELQSKKTREENLNLVRGKLQERFGTNYSTKELAGRIGVDESYFVETAANHPQIILKTLGLDQPKRNKETMFDTPPSNSRQSTFVPEQTERTESYYKKLAKEKGVNIYLDRDISLQMHKDAQRLGEKFFDEE